MTVPNSSGPMVAHHLEWGFQMGINNEEPQHYLARNWKPVTITGLICCIPALIAANTWYVNWHDIHNDSRYVSKTFANETFAKKSEVTILAGAEDLRQQVAQIDENLDFLVKSAAVQAVDRIKGELSLHKLQEDGSQLWRRQKDEIERRLANAEAYRDCLFNSRTNCDASRVW